MVQRDDWKLIVYARELLPFEEFFQSKDEHWTPQLWLPILLLQSLVGFGSSTRLGPFSTHERLLVIPLLIIYDFLISFLQHGAYFMLLSLLGSLLYEQHFLSFISDALLKVLPSFIPALPFILHVFKSSQGDFQYVFSDAPTFSQLLSALLATWVIDVLLDAKFSLFFPRLYEPPL